jgi:hypothetical protein
MGKKTVLITLLAGTLLLPARRAAALETDDLLSLVAMPLAVAAVSEMTDVPMNQLMDVVSLLNDAQVPPTQFVEVVRYVPVVLVVDADRTDFVDFVRVQEQEGLRGTALVTSIEERMHTVYDFPSADFDIVRPRVIDVVETEFVPTVVRTRITEVRTQRAHPHGGPPGQLKKAAGVQTGAEIVHGGTRVDDHRAVRTVKVKTPKQETRRVEIADDHRGQTHARGREKAEKHEKHDNDNGKGHGNGKSHGNGKKGKG